MASTPVLKISGLHTSDNPYSGVPEGALVLATNAVLRYKNRLGPRRGQKKYAYEFGGGSDRANEGVWYQDTLVQHYASTKLTRDTGAAFSDYSGSYTPPDAAAVRMKFMEAAQNLYFNTTLGQYVLDVVTGTPAKAGVPKGLGQYIYSSSTHYLIGDDGWMAPNTAVAYRFVWGVKDANGNVKLGPPSERFVVPNLIRAPIGNVARAANVVTVTAGIHQFIIGDVVTLLTPDATFLAGPHTITAVTLGTFSYAEVAANASSAIEFKYGASRNPTFFPEVPPGITTSNFLRAYRTVETELASIAPDEEFFLQSEVKPTSTDISNGYMATITDRTPSVLLGPPLYTNPNTGDGAVAAKERPPVCKDMTWWDGRAWYLNTTDKHRFIISLLGIGTPDGLQHDDTITIGGATYTGKTSGGAIASSQFIINTSSNLSQQEQVEAAARSLCVTINYNSATLIAYYISGEDEAAGRILVEEIDFGGAAFSVYASRPASWGPALTTGSSGAQTSANDARPNGASYSVRDEPEACPLVDGGTVGGRLTVGPKSSAILRAVPFRDKLYVFTDSRKFYTVTGPAPYRVDEIEGSARLLSPDAVVVHANQVFALTDQGVGVLTDAGFRIVSMGIEDELLAVLKLTQSVVKRYSFALSYESDRQVQFWVPTGNSDACAKVGYVYDSIRNTWTKWEMDRTWGRVRASTDVLYMGDGADNTVRQERKTGDRTDFADETSTIPYGQPNGPGTLYSPGGAPAVGDIVYDPTSGNYALLITKVGDNYTMDASTTFAGVSGTLYKGFAVTVKTVPVAPYGPRADAHFREFLLHFGTYLARLLYATFDTDKDATGSTALMPESVGYLPSGALPAASAGVRTRICEVPQEHAQAPSIRVGFTIREAWAQWLFDGFTLEHEPAGRTVR